MNAPVAASDLADLSMTEAADAFARGEVTAEQLKNRHLLRDVMHAAGFTQLAHEWWHFDALTRDEARASYRIVE